MNSTISGNFSGGISTNGGEIGNTILNNNSGFNIDGTITSHGYNLSSDDGGGNLTGPGDQINTDPMIGPLQNNGGPTLTHALLPGSPAINAGDPNFTPPPFYDQRGYPFVRVFNGRIDIGSFETQPPRRPLLHQGRVQLRSLARRRHDSTFGNRLLLAKLTVNSVTTNPKRTFMRTRLRLVCCLFLVAGAAVGLPRTVAAQGMDGNDRVDGQCDPILRLSEFFDSVTPPALPSGWSSTTWVTSNSGVPAPPADTHPMLCS